MAYHILLTRVQNVTLIRFLWNIWSHVTIFAPFIKRLLCTLTVTFKFSSAFVIKQVFSFNHNATKGLRRREGYEHIIDYEIAVLCELGNADDKWCCWLWVWLVWVLALGSVTGPVPLVSIPINHQACKWHGAGGGASARPSASASALVLVYRLVVLLGSIRLAQFWLPWCEVF